MCWPIDSDERAAGLVAMFSGRRRPGKTYQGFVSALAARSQTLLARIADHLRGEVRRVAGASHWEHQGFVPIGADGSKVECPKTLNNEQEFGCASKKKGAPQQFVTTLLHLPTGVVWEFKTGPARASERHHLRQMRWGVELHYRALKQTLCRRKLLSDAPRTAKMELCWAMMSLWLLCLMSAGAIVKSGKDIRRLSVATALRIVRKAMRAPHTRSGSAGLGRQLTRAVKDSYKRITSKRARAWAHKKKPKPIGDPKARIADESQVQLARELRELATAA